MSRIQATHTLPEDVDVSYQNMKNVLWFVLYDREGQWIGFAGIQKKNEVPYFGPSFIKENYRGQGLQRALIAARIHFSRRRGYKVVTTIVDDFNTASISNVTRMGFTETKRVGSEIFYELKL